MKTIGIDVGGTHLKLGVVSEAGEILLRLTRPSVHDPMGLAQTLYQMTNMAKERFPDANVGLSMPGTLNRNGKLDASQMGFFDVPMASILRDVFGHAVPFENDGVCALLAEHRTGALQGCSTGILITLGTGIGGGVIADGKVLRGKNGVHCELGHMITHVDGRPCACGQNGCWESYASVSALRGDAGGMEPRELLANVQNGRMVDVWERYIHEIAQGLLGLCSLFCPEIIAIGGGLSNAGDFLIRSIQNEIRKERAYHLYYSDISIVSAHHKNDAGILGAAALAVIPDFVNHT